MSRSRVIPLGIPWTARSAKRRKAEFIAFNERDLTESQRAGRITVEGRIKRSNIINMYPDDAPGWWYVKYRDESGRIYWVRVREEDI